MELCKAKQRGGTELLEKMWSMTKPRTPKLYCYVVYMVRSTIVFRDMLAYEAFLEKFAADRPREVYLFGEPLPYKSGYLSIEIVGVGEGQDDDRARSYFRYPKSPITDKGRHRLKASLYHTAHHAAEKTEGAFWRTCPIITETPLVRVQTLKDYGTSTSQKTPGLALESVSIVQLQLNTKGIVFFNKQIGANQQFMFPSLYHYKDPAKFGKASEGGERFTCGGRGGAYTRVDADYEAMMEDEEEPEECVELERDFTLRYEPEMLEMLVYACGDLVSYEAIEDIMDASYGLLFRFTVVKFTSALIADARREPGAPAPFDLFAPDRLARVRYETGLWPSHSYTVLLSDDAAALLAVLVDANVLLDDKSLPSHDDIEEQFESYVSIENPPAFAAAADSYAVQANELLTLVRREMPGPYAGGLDRFLAVLIPLWKASSKEKGLLEDAQMLAAARHASGTYPCYYEWLLGDGALAIKVRGLLPDLDLPCGKPIDFAKPDAINDEFKDFVIRQARTPLFLALKDADQDNRDPDAVRLHGVRVTVVSVGWTYVGDSGLECVLVQLVKRCGTCKDGLLASVPWLVDARRACPALYSGAWLKALLDPYDERGIQVREAMEAAGLFRELASFESYEDAVRARDAKETLLYSACVKAEKSPGPAKCATTIAAVRVLVGVSRSSGIEGVDWTTFDAVMAAAVPLAQAANGHLFAADILKAALISSEKQASFFYPFLIALANKDRAAEAAQKLFVDAGMDAGGDYTLGTPAAVKALFNPPNEPEFYKAAKAAGLTGLDVEIANKVISAWAKFGHTKERSDAFLTALMRRALEKRATAGEGRSESFTFSAGRWV